MINNAIAHQLLVKMRSASDLLYTIVGCFETLNHVKTYQINF
jgi:hypothetical protein